MSRVIPTQILLLLLPLILIQLVLMVYALIDLLRPERAVKGGNKLIWGIVIVLVSTLGPLIYLLAGREEHNGTSDSLRRIG
jgi:hypothetical protein